MVWLCFGGRIWFVLWLLDACVFCFYVCYRVIYFHLCVICCLLTYTYTLLDACVFCHIKKIKVRIIVIKIEKGPFLGQLSIAKIDRKQHELG
jgi:hypothetical protein